MSRPHRERAAGDRGAVLVEFAMLFPVLAMLVFGLLSAGLAWNSNLAMAHGARAAGRYAATLPTYDYTAMDDYLDAIATRVVSASDHNVDSSVTGRIVCVAYVHPAGTDTLDHTRRRYETTTVSRSDSTCFNDGQASSERRVQIMIERGSTLETGLYSRSITLHQQVVYRYEISDGL